jgi:cold shock CspA family protein
LALHRSFFHPYRLIAPQVPFRLAVKEGSPMKYFGTVKSFDTTLEQGEINPEVAGNPIRFEVGAILWDKKISPVIGQRLSYDVGQGVDRQPTALNLQTI